MAEITGKGLKTAAWTLSIAGIILLLAASVQYLQIRNKKTKWVPVDGTVANFIVSTEEGGAAPVVIYIWEDDSLSFTSNLYNSPPSFNLGDTVSLFVNPGAPDEVVLDQFQLYLLSLVLFVLGFLFDVVGLSILFFSKKIT